MKSLLLSFLILLSGWAFGATVEQNLANGIPVSDQPIVPADGQVWSMYTTTAFRPNPNAKLFTNGWFLTTGTTITSNGNVVQLRASADATLGITDSEGNGLLRIGTDATVFSSTDNSGADVYVQARSGNGTGLYGGSIIFSPGAKAGGGADGLVASYGTLKLSDNAGTGAGSITSVTGQDIDFAAAGGGKLSVSRVMTFPSVHSPFRFGVKEFSDTDSAMMWAYNWDGTGVFTKEDPTDVYWGWNLEGKWTNDAGATYLVESNLDYQAASGSILTLTPNATPGNHNVTSNIITFMVSDTTGLVAGSAVVVAGFTHADYNGTYTVYDVPDGTSFRVVKTTSQACSVVGTISNHTTRRPFTVNIDRATHITSLGLYANQIGFGDETTDTVVNWHRTRGFDDLVIQDNAGIRNVRINVQNGASGDRTFYLASPSTASGGNIIVSPTNVSIVTTSDVTGNTLVATTTATAASLVVATANGAKLTSTSISEEVTVSASPTDSTLNLLPANSYIKAVTYRVTETIDCGMSFDVGVDGDTTRFGQAMPRWIDSTGQTWKVMGTGPAVRLNPYVNGAAAKIRITPDAGEYTTGKVRITVFYETVTEPGN